MLTYVIKCDAITPFVVDRKQGIIEEIKTTFAEIGVSKEELPYTIDSLLQKIAYGLPKKEGYIVADNMNKVLLDKCIKIITNTVSSKFVKVNEFKGSNLATSLTFSIKILSE